MRSFRFLSLCIVLTIMFVSLYGYEDSHLYAYVRSYPHTVGKAALSPLDWDTKQWLTAGGIVLLTGTLYLADEEIRDLAQRNRSQWTDHTASYFRQFGEAWTLPALGLTALSGHLLGSEKMVDTGLLGLKSMLLARSVTGGLKIMSQRNRPFREQGKQLWDEGSFSMNRDSFPSGHATMVWSLAPILAHQFADHKWVSPVVYSVASLTSLSRINDDKHWASDVCFGAVVGYVTAQLTLHDTPRLLVLPDAELQGLVFEYRF